MVMLDFKQEVDNFFARLKAKGFVPEEDIAWVGVPYEYLVQLAKLKVCPVRHCFYCEYQGVEFRELERKNPRYFQLEGWFAWNITGRTKKLFIVKDEKDDSD
jgi:hypothetical protein